MIDRAVIVAVLGVRMVQMVANAVVDVIAMGDGDVTAVGSVGVTGFVLAAGLRQASSRVHHRDRDACVVARHPLSPVS